MKKVIGLSILRRGEGFEPVKVFSDLTTCFIYPDEDFLYYGGKFVMSSAAAICEGRSLARAHKIPFRIRLSAFKSLIEEVTDNA